MNEQISNKILAVRNVTLRSSINVDGDHREWWEKSQDGEIEEPYSVDLQKCSS